MMNESTNNLSKEQQFYIKKQDSINTLSCSFKFLYLHFLLFYGRYLPTTESSIPLSSAALPGCFLPVRNYSSPETS